MKITENVANSYGGGVGVGKTQILEIGSSNISFNTAVVGGSALYVYELDNLNSVLLMDSIFRIYIKISITSI